MHFLCPVRQRRRAIPHLVTALELYPLEGHVTEHIGLLCDRAARARAGSSAAATLLLHLRSCKAGEADWVRNSLPAGPVPESLGVRVQRPPRLLHAHSPRQAAPAHPQDAQQDRLSWAVQGPLLSRTLWPLHSLACAFFSDHRDLTSFLWQQRVGIVSCPSPRRSRSCSRSEKLTGRSSRSRRPLGGLARRSPRLECVLQNRRALPDATLRHVFCDRMAGALSCKIRQFSF